MFWCTAWKMQKSAVILLFIPHLLEAGLISEPNNIDTCVGSDIKLNWKYDNPGQIQAVVYKVTLAGTSALTILAYDGTNAIVINNYNVRWDNNSGSITIVNSALNNTGSYNIDVSYASTLLQDSHTVPVLVLDPPKTLSAKKNNTEFTCELGSSGTPSVLLYLQVDGVKQTTPTVTAPPYKKVECCISGAAVKCMSETNDSTYCILAQDPYCPFYRLVVLALFVYVFLVAIESIVVYALAKNDKVVPECVMRVMIITLNVLTVWALGMIFLLFECTVTDQPLWSIVLAALSVYATVVSVAVNISPMICCSGRKNGRLLRKIHCCEKMDEEERKHLAGVLVVIFWFPWTFGLILLVPLCI